MTYKVGGTYRRRMSGLTGGRLKITGESEKSWIIQVAGCREELYPKNQFSEYYEPAPPELRAGQLYRLKQGFGPSPYRVELFNGTYVGLVRVDDPYPILITRQSLERGWELVES